MTPRAGAALLAVSLGAGLVTGLARFPDPVALRLAVVASALVDRRASTLALAASALGGHFLGLDLAAGDTTGCAARLPLGERTFRLRLLDPGSATGRAEPLDADCRGAVRVRWSRDTVIAAGATATVRARWSPRERRLGPPDGLLLVRTIVRVEPGGGWVAATRTAVHRAIRDLFGPRAGLVDALVTGRSGAIPAEVRERFAASGLVHILSISGFHMSLIGFWLLLGLGVAGIPGHRARPIAAISVLCYAAWLGWPPPATRAAALFAILVIARWRQRALRPDGVLGACAIVVLAIDPRAVVDLGAWLSFAAMAGVIGASRWYRRQVDAPNAVVEGIAASIGATLTTAPIAALTIGRVAAIGPLVNLPAIPLAALVMPALLAALAFTPIIPPLGHAFAAIASVMLAALDRVAAMGASLPGAAGASSPGWQAAAPWCALLVLAWQATAGNAAWRESLRRSAWGAVAFVWWPLVLAMPQVAMRDGPLRIAFLDVGQGDAAVIRTPNGRWIVIDAGPSSPTWDAGARVVAPWLRRHGARAIDVLVVSHAHRDHFGGVASVVEALPVGVIVEPGEPVEDAAYFALLETLATRQVRWRRGNAGDRVVIDGVHLEVLSPGHSRTGDLNEDSVVLLLRYGEFTALFTGDAGERTESAWGREPVTVDLLKVGHHGSATATSTALLRALDADAAVISLGRNTYGHPAPSTLHPRPAPGRRHPALAHRSGGYRERGERWPYLCGAWRGTRRAPRRPRPDHGDLIVLHPTKVTTLERFILDQERVHPEATGELTNLLYDIALAAKLIAAAIRRAGLVNILGAVGNTNVQGEEQQKLDIFANETMKNALNHTGRICAMASEEDEELIAVPAGVPQGKYVVLFDPLDGSSNIDVNAAVGTIFSIYRRTTDGGPGTLADVLQPGHQQVAAGYVIYGSSVMMVYSAGHGVHGFTLDPTIGEFLLSSKRMQMPASATYYSVNESNFPRWSRGIQAAVRGFKGDDPERVKGKNSRYIGSLVADFHRNLVKGGIFLYPGDRKNPRGKLRLLYECAPMAFLAEQAGGAATDGRTRILDLVPTALHERVPLVIGCTGDVEYVRQVLAEVEGDT